jgi:heme A synthase
MPLVLVLIQVVLGILTVLWANYPKALLWLGAAHQFTAMLLVLVWTTVLYVLRSGK